MQYIRLNKRLAILIFKNLISELSKINNVAEKLNIIIVAIMRNARNILKNFRSIVFLEVSIKNSSLNILDIFYEIFLRNIAKFCMISEYFLKKNI